MENVQPAQYTQMALKLIYRANIFVVNRATRRCSWGATTATTS